jgi:redox-sensitive bicupin YhaK (pirin superfamily)
MHRDSLGFAQPIRAGAVNLMTAGRGIVHSERAGEDLDTTSRLHGIQSWMALPQDQEECEPAFVHYPASELPELEKNGNTIRLIIGEAFGIRSPVATRARMLYLECRMREGATLALPDSEQELAAYVVSGQARIGDRSLGEGTMAVLHVGTAARMEANKESRVMIIGGEGLGERHIWWNFVSSSRERIRQASDDWRQERFAMVPGDDEFIPLPD